MKVKLIAAALAILGLVACSPDITPQAGTETDSPAASSAPAQPATEQQAVQASPPATAAPDERKDDGATPAAEAKTDGAEKKTD